MLGSPLLSSFLRLISRLLYGRGIRVVALMVLIFPSLRHFIPYLGMLLGLCLTNFIILRLFPIVSPPSTLIPKVDSPSQFREFQVISVVGSFYKILPKSLWLGFLVLWINLSLITS